ncbi:MAG: hypothetical protein ACYCU7_08730 [Acidimicrobiales bacterium]
MVGEHADPLHLDLDHVAGLDLLRFERRRGTDGIAEVSSALSRTL